MAKVFCLFFSSLLLYVAWICFTELTGKDAVWGMVIGTYVIFAAIFATAFLWPQPEPEEDDNAFEGCEFCGSKFDRARTTHYCTHATRAAHDLKREVKALKAKYEPKVGPAAPEKAV